MDSIDGEKEEYAEQGQHNEKPLAGGDTKEKSQNHDCKRDDRKHFHPEIQSVVAGTNSIWQGIAQNEGGCSKDNGNYPKDTSRVSKSFAHPYLFDVSHTC